MALLFSTVRVIIIKKKQRTRHPEAVFGLGGFLKQDGTCTLDRVPGSQQVGGITLYLIIMVIMSSSPAW